MPQIIPYVHHAAPPQADQWTNFALAYGVIFVAVVLAVVWLTIGIGKR